MNTTSRCVVALAIAAIGAASMALAAHRSGAPPELAASWRASNASQASLGAPHTTREPEHPNVHRDPELSGRAAHLDAGSVRHGSRVIPRTLTEYTSCPDRWAGKGPDGQDVWDHQEHCRIYFYVAPDGTEYEAVRYVAAVAPCMHGQLEDWTECDDMARATMERHRWQPPGAPRTWGEEDASAP
jgi:hypothetical protein